MTRARSISAIVAVVFSAGLGACEDTVTEADATDAAAPAAAHDAGSVANGGETEPAADEQEAPVYVLSDDPGGQSGGSSGCGIAGEETFVPPPTSAAALLDRSFETELVVRPWYGSTAAQRDPATRMPMTVELTRSPVSLRHLGVPGGGCGPDVPHEVDVWLRLPDSMTTFRVPAILHQTADRSGHLSILLAPEAGEHFPGGSEVVQLGAEPAPLRFTLGLDDGRVSGTLQQAGRSPRGYWRSCVVSAWPHEGLCRPGEEAWARDTANLQDRFDAAQAVAMEPRTLRWTQGETTELSLSLSPLQEPLCAVREERAFESQPVVSHLVRAPYAGHLTTADGRVDVHMTIWIGLQVAQDDPDYGGVAISGALVVPVSKLDGTLDFGIPEGRLVQVSYRDEPGSMYPRELFVMTQSPHPDLPPLDGPVDGEALSGANLDCWNDPASRAVAALRDPNWE